MKYLSNPFSLIRYIYIKENMGRLKRTVELSEEEKQKLIERRRASAKRYYWKNKDHIDKVCRERYQSKIKSNNELRKDL